MNVKAARRKRLCTRSALASALHATAFFLLGCTAGGLELAAWNKSGQTAVVAGERAADATDGQMQTPDIDAEVNADTDADVSLDDYDAHLARIRAGDCRGFAARVGTCGGCLAIIEFHIDVAWESYYDPETKRLVAQYLYDPMSGVDTWTPDSTDCAAEQFVQDEFIICER